jgi:hypothetical protein
MHPKYWKRKAQNYVFRDEATDGTTGSTGGGALDAHGAAEAFGAILGGDEPKLEAAAEAKNDPPADETEEAAAERLVAEAAKGDEKPEGEQAAEPQKFTIKVDGKDVELTADEVAEHYKNGLRQQDYTKKTMEAAETRKAADAEVQKARAQRDEYAAKLEGFKSQADYEIANLRAHLTLELLDSDPVEYGRIKHIVEERQVQLQQAQQELGQINEQRKHEKAEADRISIQDQHEKLVAKVPEWKDPAKLKDGLAKLGEYLAHEGYADDSADMPRHLQVLMAKKAMEYDALMARAKEATKKVAAAPAKVERPGNTESVKPTDGRTSAMKKLAATGSIADAAAVFGQIYN